MIIKNFLAAGIHDILIIYFCSYVASNRQMTTIYFIQVVHKYMMLYG